LLTIIGNDKGESMVAMITIGMSWGFLGEIGGKSIEKA